MTRNRSDEPSNGRLARILKHPVTGILGLLAAILAVASFVFPDDYDWVSERIGCLWRDCSKAHVFAPVATDGCETGAIGPIIANARLLGAVRTLDQALGANDSPDPGEERVADLHICDNNRMESSDLAKLLVRIATEYDECIDFDREASTPVGHRLAVFVKLESPAVCAAPIRKQDGEWIRDGAERTRLLCFPHAAPHEPASAASAVRMCTRAELLPLGLPCDLVNKLTPADATQQQPDRCKEG